MHVIPFTRNADLTKTENNHIRRGRRLEICECGRGEEKAKSVLEINNNVQHTHTHTKRQGKKERKQI